MSSIRRRLRFLSKSVTNKNITNVPTISLMEIEDSKSAAIH